MATLPYTAGDALTAAEYNEVAKAAGIYAAAGGSANAFTLTTTPAISSYVTGMVFRFKANHSITGTATLNVSGKGAVTIMKNLNTPLVEGDIVNGQMVTVMYDGTNFQMLSPQVTLPTFIEMYGAVSSELANLTKYQVTSSPDGSDIYAAFNVGTAPNLRIDVHRFTRDTLTGQYYHTGQSIQLISDQGIDQSNTISCGIACGVNYVWVAGEDMSATNVKIIRLNRNLTGAQQMTISGSDFSTPGKMCGDDTQLWIASNTTSTTLAYYTISGTTATRGTNVTISETQGQYMQGLFFDGTDLLFMDSNDQFKIRRHNTSGISQATATRRFFGINSHTTAGSEIGFGCGITYRSKNTIYLIGFFLISDENTSGIGSRLKGFAITKP